MTIREKTVTEFEIVSAALPGIPFAVRAETQDKAIKKLVADLKAVIAELSGHLKKAPEHKPVTTHESHA